MIERIKLLIKEKAKSVREFAGLIGVNQQTLNQQIVGDRKLSLDIVSAILDAFPDVSAEWLLRGKGDMKSKSDAFSIDEELNKDFDSNQSVSRTEFLLLANQLLELTKLTKLQGRELKSVNERMVIVEDRLRQTKSA